MATPSVAEMMDDLRAADASGDTQLAQHIAGLIRAAEGPKAPSEEPASLGTKVRQFFDPTYPSPSADLGDVGRQALKAGSFLVPGGTLAKGALAGGMFAASDKDATLGEVAGGAAGGALVGKALPYVAGKLGSFARGKVDAAEAKTLAQAAGEKMAELKSATSSLGGASQDLNRKVEWVIRLLDEEASGALSPANRKLLEQFRQAPEYAEVVNKAAERVLASAPGSAGRVAAKEANVAALNQSLPQDIISRSDQLLSPATAKEQLMSRLKRYWLPAAGGAIGGAVGGPVGVGVGALAGRGLSPSVQALGRMMKHPSWQKAMYEPLAGFGSGAVSKSVAPALIGAEAGAAAAPFGIRLATSAAGGTPSSTEGSPPEASIAPRDSTPSGVIGNALRNNPQAFGRFSAPLQSAAQRGDGSLGAAHFILYQNEPEYRKVYDALQKGER